MAFQLSQMMCRIISVMTRPMIGSTTGAPRAIAAALMITPAETIASERAWWPSAMRAGLLSRRPATEAHAGRNDVADDADGPGEAARLSGARFFRKDYREWNPAGVATSAIWPAVDHDRPPSACQQV